MPLVSKGMTALLLLGLAAMVTNPDQVAYSDYLVSKWQATSCQPVEPPAMAQVPCVLVRTIPRSLMRGVIGNYTHRQDYVFFSLYTAEFMGWRDRSLGFGHHFWSLP